MRLPASILLVAACALPAGAAPRALLVKAGLVIPVEGEPIRNGAVLCRDGKIVAVGRQGEIPEEGAEVLDLGIATLVPGLVAVSSGFAAPGAGAPESVSPDVRAIDGFDFDRPQSRALEGGITTAYLDAGRRRVIGGQAAIVKLAGTSPESRTLRARAGLFGAIGDPARNPPALFDAPSSPDPVAHPLLPLRPQSPGTRMAAVAMLREAIAKGLVPAGEPLRLRADDAADLLAAAALAKETGVKIVVGGARDAALVADELKAAGISVALESPLIPGRPDDTADPEEAARRRAAMRNPAVLAEKGIPFALGASDAALPDLLSVAHAHAAAGITHDHSLRSITLDAARILGVDDRVGSLVAGKDADLFAFDESRVPLLTVVDGVVAWRREPPKDAVVLHVAAIHDGTGRVIRDGFVSLEGGKIVEVGERVGRLPGVALVERTGCIVIPGLVDAHTRLGLRAAGGDGSGSLSTAVPLAQALLADHPSFAAALEVGVTTALVSPGGRATVVGGTCVVKTAGGTLEERTLRAAAGIEVCIAGAGDLPAALGDLREAIEQAKKHHEAWEKFDKETKDYEKAKREFEAAKRKKAGDEKKPDEEKKDEPKKDEPEKKPEDRKPDEKKPDEKKPEDKKEPVEPKEPARPAVNAALEAWRDVFRKKMPIYCRVSSAAEATGAVKVVKEESKLELILVGAEESWKVAAALKKADVPVILGPRITSISEGRTVNAARALFAGGVPFAITTDAGMGVRDLPALAGWAVRHGLSDAAAVRAVTLEPARILKVDDRVGSLETGKDADFVILQGGGPFDLETRVRAVVVGGKVVWGEW